MSDAIDAVRDMDELDDRLRDAFVSLHLRIVELNRRMDDEVAELQRQRDLAAQMKNPPTQHFNAREEA